MKQFAQLYAALDGTTSTTAKVEALRSYFAQATARDAAWAAYFLSGGKPRQVVASARLRELACDMAGLPDWLFEECYQTVGDLAETIAHILPAATASAECGLADWVEQRLLPLRGLPTEQVLERVRQDWAGLDAAGRFLYVKLVGGGWRVGVSRLLVQRALAAHAGIDVKRVAQRMMGYTDSKTPPSAERFMALVAQGDADDCTDRGQPYPFFLAHPVEASPAEMPRVLGPLAQWMVEWKYDGIRAQIVRRDEAVWIWSRGEELVTERFPEIAQWAQQLPSGTVLDGEIMVWQHERPGAFSLLQQRIARKTLNRRVLADAPVRFMGYDLLEHAGEDVRAHPQQVRRAWLEALMRDAQGLLSPLVPAGDWQALSQLHGESRARGVEGFMLKRCDARYGVGRTRSDGLWLKWKVDPMTVDGVLIYAQAGHGRRASVYTDYTFAVWSRAPQDAAEAQQVIDAITRGEIAQPGALQLVPFAKAYSGLSDEEFKAVDAVIRRSTLEKFGPVRSVRPSLVFELGFEGIARSPRHKSGIALRFPRMLRRRDDKPVHEASTLADLQGLLPGA